MINTDRIVPVTKTDLLSLIGTILGLGGTRRTVPKEERGAEKAPGWISGRK